MLELKADEKVQREKNTGQARKITVGVSVVGLGSSQRHDLTDTSSLLLFLFAPNKHMYITDINM